MDMVIFIHFVLLLLKISTGEDAFLFQFLKNYGSLSTDHHMHLLKQTLALLKNISGHMKVHPRMAEINLMGTLHMLKEFLALVSSMLWIILSSFFFLLHLFLFLFYPTKTNQYIFQAPVSDSVFLKSAASMVSQFFTW